MPQRSTPAQRALRRVFENAFLDVVRRSRIGDAALRSAVDTGNVTALYAAADRAGYTRNLAPIERVMAAAHRDGQVDGLATIGGNLPTSEAVDAAGNAYAARRARAVLATQLPDAQRKSLQWMLETVRAERITRGDSTHLVQMSRGLTRPQAGALWNYRERLLADASYTAAERRALLTQYANQLTMHRAQRFARTEAVEANRAGKLDAWRHVGVLASGARLKTWRAYPGACPACLALDGTSVPLEAEFAPGVSHPPLHNNCECDIELGGDEIPLALPAGRDRNARYRNILRRLPIWLLPLLPQGRIRIPNLAKRFVTGHAAAEVLHRAQGAAFRAMPEAERIAAYTYETDRGQATQEVLRRVRDDPRFQGIVDDFANVIDRLPPVPRAITTWRGGGAIVDPNQFASPEEYARYVQGLRFLEDKGFTTTSVYPEIAVAHANRAPVGFRTIYELELPKGTKGFWMGNINPQSGENDYEFVVQRGTVFEVKGVSEIDVRGQKYTLVRVRARPDLKHPPRRPPGGDVTPDGPPSGPPPQLPPGPRGPRRPRAPRGPKPPITRKRKPVPPPAVVEGVELPPGITGEVVEGKNRWGSPEVKVVLKDATGREVGYLSAEANAIRSPDLTNKDYLVLDVYILPKFRKQKLGTAMYDALAKWSQRKGARLWSIPETMTPEGEAVFKHRMRTGRVGREREIADERGGRTKIRQVVPPGGLAPRTRPRVRPVPKRPAPRVRAPAPDASLGGRLPEAAFPRPIADPPPLVDGVGRARSLQEAMAHFRTMGVSARFTVEGRFFDTVADIPSSVSWADDPAILRIVNDAAAEFAEARRRGARLPSTVLFGDLGNELNLGRYTPSRDTIRYNVASVVMQNLRTQAGFLHSKAWHFSTPHTRHVFAHELAHVQHMWNGGANDTKLFEFVDEEQIATAREVSDYAAMHPIEFVAEVYAGLRFGRRFSSRVMEMYLFYWNPKGFAA